MRREHDYEAQGFQDDRGGGRGYRGGGCGRWRLTETPLPGTIEAIHELDITHELAGGYAVKNAGPSTSAEIEHYN